MQTSCNITIVLLQLHGVNWQPTLCVDNQRTCILVTVYCMVSMFYDTLNFLAIKNE